MITIYLDIKNELIFRLLGFWVDLCFLLLFISETNNRSQ